MNKVFLDIYEGVVDLVAQDYGVHPIYCPVFDREFFLWDDMFSWDEDNKPHPTFSVQEAAKMFFARGSWWLRWKYRDNTDNFILNGITIVPKRTASGSRYYTMADIERMAHALAESRSISGEKLTQILTLLLIQASMYGILDKPRG